MGQLTITIGQLTRSLDFPDAKGAETLRQFYDSVLSANDDPENPPSDSEKLDAILRWIANTIQAEARAHYEHTEKVRQQQTIADEARSKFELGANA